MQEWVSCQDAFATTAAAAAIVPLTAAAAVALSFESQGESRAQLPRWSEKTLAGGCAEPLNHLE
jgi:hypothetical protein